MYPAMPPMRCSRMRGACSESPASRMGPAHLATEAPTRTTVAITPTMGQNGSKARQILGAAIFARTNNDGSQHHLDGGDDNAHGIHRDHSAKHQLCKQRSHEDGADC